MRAHGREQQGNAVPRMLLGTQEFVRVLARCRNSESKCSPKPGVYYRRFERVTRASGVESARPSVRFLGSIPIADARSHLGLVVLGQSVVRWSVSDTRTS